MKIVKKENKEAYEALVFCAGAKTNHKENLDLLRVKKGRLLATDGHRLHYTPIKDIPDGLYNYEKKNTTITLTLVKDKKYADVDTWMDSLEFVQSVTVNRDEFYQRLKQVNVIPTTTWAGMKLTFNGKLEMRADNPDLGDVETEIQTDKTIDPEFTIGMNCRYILNALIDMKGKTVEIGLQYSPDCPLVFKQDNKTALIMPMRL